MRQMGRTFIRAELRIFLYSSKALPRLLTIISASLAILWQWSAASLLLLASQRQTRAAFCPDDRQLRRWMLLGTLCWLANNLLVGSPVAALMEGLFLVSNLVGYYRHYGFDYWGRGRHSGRRKRRVPPSDRASS